MSLKEKWNFTWADMGLYDMPAFMQKIIDVTGKPKVTIMGFSMGSAQMYYGLAKKQDWFAERTHRFIGLSSCIIPSIDEFMTYEGWVGKFKALDSLGYYSFHGGDGSEIDSDVVCETMDGYECFMSRSDDGRYASVASLLYFI